MLFRPSPLAQRRLSSSSSSAGADVAQNSSAFPHSGAALLRTALVTGQRALEEALGVFTITHGVAVGDPGRTIIGELEQLRLEYGAALASVG